MARIFITGSADGLGELTATSLMGDGHTVVLHARNEQRGREAMAKMPGAETVVTADLASMEETIQLAHSVNALGNFDAIIHNAGVNRTSARELFTVNTLAPYLLTCLINQPQRLVYVGSDMHAGGRAKLDLFRTDLVGITYSDTKLHVLLLCKAIAARWTNVYANTITPGWVPTKMGGADAPGDLQKGFQTQVWLAVSNEEQARVSGRYFYHQKEVVYNPVADDLAMQNRFMNLCRQLTGISIS